MRKLTIALSVASAFMATPVLACPMMTQASAQTGSSAAAGMMCGRPMTTAQAQSQPGQSTQGATQPGQQAASGCPCCRNMAMMQPGQSTPGTGGMQHMPGMQMPGAPTSPAPEAPKQ